MSSADKGRSANTKRHQQNVSVSTSASSISAFSSLLDPPPPYVLPRAHDDDNDNDNDVGVNVTAPTDPTRTPDIFTPSGTPIILSAPASTLSLNPHPGPSAHGVSIRKTLSSVDILWADMRRRRRNRTPVDYEPLEALPCEWRCDDQDYPSADENQDDQYDDDQEDICSYTVDYTTNLRPISTGSKGGMGETETEMDEPSSRLPTSRKITPPQRREQQYLSEPTSKSLLDLISGPSPTSPLSHDPSTPPLFAKLSRSRLTPILFELFRLLSVVPAGLGFLWHLLCFVRTTWPAADPLLESKQEIPEFVVRLHSPFDHFVCLLWTLLTAHQCLSLTTGLQLRWRAYYPSHATLIRLLALQAICWPATRFTLTFVNHDVRPVICWTLIGSTTCFSRAVQIWVVSNLKIVGWNRRRVRRVKTSRPFSGGGGGRSSPPHLTINTELNADHARDDDFTIKWVPRRWDWPLVIRTCVIPAAVVYFVMAWVGELRREVERG